MAGFSFKVTWALEKIISSLFLWAEKKHLLHPCFTVRSCYHPYTNLSSLNSFNPYPIHMSVGLSNHLIPPSFLYQFIQIHIVQPVSYSSVHPSVCLPVCPHMPQLNQSIHPTVRPSYVCPSVNPQISLFIVCLSIHPSVQPSINLLSVHPSICSSSVRLSVRPSIYSPPVCPSVHQTVHPLLCALWLALEVNVPGSPTWVGSGVKRWLIEEWLPHRIENTF